MNRKKWRKMAFALSAFLFVLWWALGTGTTLAWFSDVDSVRNEFQIGSLDLDVSYKNTYMDDYMPLLGTTEAFHDEALYEPGYTQVVYLKIENKGNVPFDYKVALTVKDIVYGVDMWNDEFYLSEYLRYGVVFAQTEAQLQEMLKDRLAARNLVGDDWNAMGTWSKLSDYTFEAGNGNCHYAALIVYMPEEVDNSANNRGGDAPQVEIGIKVFAQQAGAPLE